MDINKEHFRHILLYLYRRGKTAAEAEHIICDVYGADAINESTCRKWFRRSRSGDFSLEDKHRSGIPSTVDDDQILMMVQNDRHDTTQGIADRFTINHISVGRRLRKMGMVKEKDAWVPHEQLE